MATGTELFNTLDARSQAISNALDELNTVITGGETFSGTTFSHAMIWPAGAAQVDVNAHVAQISTDFANLRVTDGVENAIDTLFEGLPVGDSILSASQEISNFMQKLNQETTNILNTAGLTDRITAFQELNNPADANRTNAPYGYVPAVLNVINAAANTNLNSQPVTDALNTVAGALGSADAYRIFATYVGESTALLVKSLAVGDKTQDDR